MANPPPFRLVTDEDRDNLRMPCFVCHKTPAKTEAQYFCEYCKLIPYCSAVHQRQHWEGNHKRECQEELQGEIYPPDVRRYFEANAELKRDRKREDLLQETIRCKPAVTDFFRRQHQQTMHAVQSDQRTPREAKDRARALKGALTMMDQESAHIESVLAAEARAPQKNQNLMSILFAEVKALSAYADAYVAEVMEGNSNDMPDETTLALTALVNLTITNALGTVPDDGGGEDDGDDSSLVIAAPKVGMWNGPDDGSMLALFRGTFSEADFFALVRDVMTQRVAGKNEYVFKDEWGGRAYDWFLRWNLDFFSQLRAIVYTRVMSYWWSDANRDRMRIIIDDHVGSGGRMNAFVAELNSPLPHVKLRAKRKLMVCYRQFVDENPFMHHLIGSIATFISHTVKLLCGYGLFYMVNSIASAVMKTATPSDSLGLLQTDNKRIKEEFLDGLNIVGGEGRSDAYGYINTAYDNARKLQELRTTPATFILVEGASVSVASQIKLYESNLDDSVKKATEALAALVRRGKGWFASSPVLGFDDAKIKAFVEALANKDVIYRYYGASGALLTGGNSVPGLAMGMGRTLATVLLRGSMLGSENAADMNALSMAQYGPNAAVNWFWHFVNYYQTRAYIGIIHVSLRAIGFFWTPPPTDDTLDQPTAFEEAFSSNRTIAAAVRTFLYKPHFPKQLYDVEQAHQGETMAHQAARDERIWKTISSISAGVLGLGLATVMRTTLPRLGDFIAYQPYVAYFINVDLISNPNRDIGAMFASSYLPRPVAYAMGIVIDTLNLSAPMAMGLFAAAGATAYLLKDYIFELSKKWLDNYFAPAPPTTQHRRRGSIIVHPPVPQGPGTCSICTRKIFDIIILLIRFSALIPILAASGIYLEW